MATEEQRHPEDAVVFGAVDWLFVSEANSFGKRQVRETRHGSPQRPGATHTAREGGFRQQRISNVDVGCGFQPHIPIFTDELSCVCGSTVVRIERQRCIAVHLPAHRLHVLKGHAD